MFSIFIPASYGATCWTTLGALTFMGGEKEFNKYMASFSRLIRDTIEMSSVDKVTVADELSYIKNYIELQDHKLLSLVLAGRHAKQALGKWFLLTNWNLERAGHTD